MAQARSARLDDRAVVEIKGEGAAGFLAGLATVELSHLADEAPRHGALLTPQGKILFEFGIHPSQGGILLDVAKELRDELVKRLMFYRLRLKLDIGPREDLAPFAVWGGDLEANDLPTDSRLAALGRRGVRKAAKSPEEVAPGSAPATTAEWHVHRIAHGVAECCRDYQPNEVFPHEANLDGLHSVDFDKGCYVGQEVVSRMHHRGTAKKRFLIVEGRGHLPPAGTEIRDGETLVGTMGSSAGPEGLALVRLDRAAEAAAAGRTLEAAGELLLPRLPDWAPFTLAAPPSEARA
ncbi:YgfZ/GcvT domain-containing protein [Lutibaculum baratangense]|uniref:Folate-dependent protein for Fe/S cluster synthesis/repair in oxidative stress n=1 Tax=Lutibaculum baratangense AMV1 TaxID=631454 RepID=V4QYC7_9HYPH|nr:folate-binding protein YgfZ [Lutibaculum baratangense]ESR24762.1 Folate-dependent protein for Fe/S cluster synthesis/repair in oxidative stress [Lutibaculum baratangense AMV1]